MSSPITHSTLLRMMLLEKTLSAQPTEKRTPYLLFSNVLPDTSAPKLSSMAIPASPLSCT